VPVCVVAMGCATRTGWDAGAGSRLAYGLPSAMAPEGARRSAGSGQWRLIAGRAKPEPPVHGVAPWPDGLPACPGPCIEKTIPVYPVDTRCPRLVTEIRASQDAMGE